jgi:hypothetical protein
MEEDDSGPERTAAGRKRLLGRSAANRFTFLSRPWIRAPGGRRAAPGRNTHIGANEPPQPRSAWPFWTLTAAGPALLTEQGEERLAALVGDGEGLGTKLLLDLQGLEHCRGSLHVCVCQRPDPGRN